MYGIVTNVEGPLRERIEQAWEELRAEHGPQATYGHNLPHVSYHVADDYDLHAIERLFARLSSEQPAFDARVAGIGTVAHQANRVVWMNVVRSPALTALQDALWDDATTAGAGVIDRYHRDIWFPHVTLGDAPLLLQALPALAQRMAADPTPDSFRVDNLALIEEMPYGHELRQRVSLWG